MTVPQMEAPAGIGGEGSITDMIDTATDNQQQQSLSRVALVGVVVVVAIILLGGT